MASQLADLPELRCGLTPGAGSTGVASCIFLAPLLAWSCWVPPQLLPALPPETSPPGSRVCCLAGAWVRADLPAVWGLLPLRDATGPPASTPPQGRCLQVSWQLAAWLPPTCTLSSGGVLVSAIGVFCRVSPLPSSQRDQASCKDLKT